MRRTIGPSFLALGLVFLAIGFVQQGFTLSFESGFFSAGKRKLLGAIRRLLGCYNLKSLSQDLARFMGLVLRCPSCGSEMRWVQAIQPQTRAPPRQRSFK